jgi:hypothetical protein
LNGTVTGDFWRRGRIFGGSALEACLASCRSSQAGHRLHQMPQRPRGHMCRAIRGGRGPSRSVGRHSETFPRSVPHHLPAGLTHKKSQLTTGEEFLRSCFCTVFLVQRALRNTSHFPVFARSFMRSALNCAFFLPLEICFSTNANRN